MFSESAGVDSGWARATKCGRIRYARTSAAGRAWLGGASLLALALATAAAPQTAKAQDWSGAVSSDWRNRGNWAQNTLPTRSTSVVIDTVTPNPTVVDGGGVETNGLKIGRTGAGNLFLKGGADLTVNDAFVIGETGAGTFKSEANTLLTTWSSFVIGKEATGEGVFNFGGANSQLYGGSNDFIWGDAGKATIRIDDGAHAITNRWLYLAKQVGSEASLTISGAGSNAFANFDVVVGAAGNGLLVVNNGASLTTNGTVSFGSVATGEGKGLFTGAGSKLDGNSGIVVGDQGKGELTIADGALAEIKRAANFDVTVGNKKGSNGLLVITGAGSHLETSGIYGGEEGVGVIRIEDGGSSNPTNVRLGIRAGSTGLLTVTGEGSALKDGNLHYIGSSGQGTLLIEKGGDMDVDYMTIGTYAGGVGVLKVSGAGSTVTGTGRVGSIATIDVGSSGDGSLIIEDGGKVTSAHHVDIGSGTGKGLLSIGGAGSQLTVSNGLNVGYETSNKVATQGTVTVEAGGFLWSTQDFNVGATGLSVASATITGATTRTTVGRNFNIGRAGAGAVTLSDGAMVTTTGIISLASSAGGTGTLDVDGATLKGNSFIFVGNEGAATFNLFGGSELSAAGSLSIGGYREASAALGTGAMTVRGPGTSAAIAGWIDVGASRTGALTIADTAAVSAGYGVVVGNLATASGVLAIGAGVDGAGQLLAPREAGLLTTGDIANAGGGLIRFGDGGGSLVFNHMATEVAPFILDTKLSSGTGAARIRQAAGYTRLSGDGSAFAGTTEISGGTLALLGSLGGTASLFGGGVLSGSGALANLAVGAGGHVSPGPGIATLKVSGPLQFAADSIFEVDIAGDGRSDRLEVGGLATLAGTVQITALDPATSYQNGQSYTFLTAGSLSGTFDQVLSQSAFLTPSLRYSGSSVLLDIGLKAASDPGTPVNVTSSTNAGAGSLRAAVTQANVDPGATIIRSQLAAGTQINLTGGPLTVNGPLTLSGANPFTVASASGGVLSISGGSVVTVEAPVTVRSTAAPDSADPTGGAIVLASGGNTLNAAGDIRTTGNVMAGVLAQGADNTIRIGGSIGTERFMAHGVTSQGSGGVVDVTGSLTTLGNAAYGVQIDGGNGKLTLSGRVNTSGSGAYGVQLTGAGHAVAISGEIDTSASDAGGLRLDGNGAVIEVSGAIRTTGSRSHGILATAASGGTNVTVLGTISATGADAHAITLGDGDDTVRLLPGFKVTGLIDGGGGRDVFILDGDAGTTETIDIDVSNHGRALNFEEIVKRGAGTWRVVGAFNAPVTMPQARVEAGRVAVDGDFPTLPLTVQSGGVLGGIGRLGSLTAANGGKVAPGNSIGTLKIAGDATFAAGSVFEVEVAGNGMSDKLEVGGKATLQGAGVSVIALDPATSYQTGQSYTILTATGGVTGTFAAPTTPSAFLQPTLSYSANAVTLAIGLNGSGPTPPVDPHPVDPTPVDPGNPSPNPGTPSQPGLVLFPTVAETTNQYQTASALDGLDQSSGSDALAVYNQILVLSAADARSAFALASGEGHASQRHAIESGVDLFSGALRRRSFETSGTPFWGAALAADHSFDADGNAAATDVRTAGLAAGYEGRFANGDSETLLGIAAGYLRSETDVDARLSYLENHGFHLAAYGAVTRGPLRVEGAATYAADQTESRRRVAFGTLSRTASADYSSRTVGLSGEARYAIAMGGGVLVSPLLSFAALRSGRDAFQEEGADALSLSGAGEHWRRLDLGLGVAVSQTRQVRGGDLTFEGRAIYEVTDGDRASGQTLRFAGSSTVFRVAGVAVEDDRLRVGVDARFTADETLQIRAGYEGLVSHSGYGHAAYVTVGWRF